MTTRHTTPSFSQIQQPIIQSLQDVEQLMISYLETDVPLLGEIGRYIVKSGGKRVRPALVLLSAGTVGQITQAAKITACIVEYLHTATLLHDDVVDNATLRRSKKTARTVWGNEAAVLVGDYLFGAAFNQLSELGDMRLVAILADTSTKMARGEIKQLSRAMNSTDEEEYLNIIYYKTATLMGAAMKMGAILGGGDDAACSALYDCGINIGIAFQLVDDALDYDLGNLAKGKQAGVDLKERKVTMPLGHLMKNVSASEKNTIQSILDSETITDEHVKTICDWIKKYGSIKYTLERATEYVNKAKAKVQGFPDSEYKRGISDLADFIVSRNR